MSKLDTQLVNEAVEKLLAYSKGEELDGVKGKLRKFTETIDLQVRACTGSVGAESLALTAHHFGRPVFRACARHQIT